MRRIIMIALIAVILAGTLGCSRSKRIANDMDWIVFDGEPSKEN